MKSGFIGLIGRPNAGKSTLLNSLLGEKIAITTHKAQTTRNSILGILNEDDSQLIFVDTPGIHEATSALGNFMNKEAMSQAAGVDIICYIVDGKNGLQDEDEDILAKLSTYDIPIFLLLNKIDDMDKNLIMKHLAYATAKFDFKEIIPISAKNKDNLDELINTIKNYLGDSIQYYPNDVKTNVNIDFKISEIIREKVIINTREEVPHLVACRVDVIKERTSKVFIEASIICNKQAHKGIIIGKSGSMLKKINEAASSDISRLFDNKKIILSLFVKVEEDWLNKQKKLFELGYFTGDKDE